MAKKWSKLNYICFTQAQLSIHDIFEKLGQIFKQIYQQVKRFSQNVRGNAINASICKKVERNQQFKNRFYDFMRGEP